jgi:hypothetical protein
MSTAEQISTALKAVISAHGEWSAHKIDLGHNIFTTDKPLPIGFPDVVCVVQDFIKKPLTNLRVLDLACLEGGHAIEFGRNGCEVVGIEGRGSSLAKCHFARDVLQLSQVQFFHDDVRNFTKEKYGLFDIVICSGILYHLDVPDNFKLLENIAKSCTNLMYLNTHFIGNEAIPSVHKLGPLESVTYGKHLYQGMPLKEHEATDTMDIRQQRIWASIDNDYSFWLTLDSLKDFIHRVGFNRIYHSLSHWHVAHRGAFIAVK